MNRNLWTALLLGALALTAFLWIVVKYWLLSR